MKTGELWCPSACQCWCAGAGVAVLLQVVAGKGKYISYALDTKGPEIRTAMLKDGKDIMLTKGAAGPADISRAGRHSFTHWMPLAPPSCRWYAGGLAGGMLL